MMGNREIKKDPFSKSQQLNPYLLTTPFAVVVLLHIVGWIFPGNATWGFNFWSLTDPVVAFCVFTAAILLLLPPVSRAALRPLSKTRAFTGLAKRAGKTCVFILLSGLALAVLYYFRSRALVYGDGFTVLNDAGDSGAITLHFQYKFQILSVYFYRYAFQLVKNLSGFEPEQIYSLINAVGGLIGLWALVRISRQITSSESSRTFVLLGALSSASVLLFFGYIENYTWALAMALWSLSFAIGYSQRENGVTGLVIFSFLAFAYHMITLPFVIVALMSLFMRGSPSGNYVLGLRLRAINIALAMNSLVIVALSQIGGIDIFVALVPGAENSYWVLSRAHLVDVFNETVLVAGLGLAILIFERFQISRQITAVGTIDGILGSAALLTVLAAFWIDPGIGAPRDWDLLSFAGFPVTLWALYRFTKIFPLRDIPSQWIVPVVVVLFVHLGANVYEKNNPQLAVERLDRLLAGDPHYSEDYQRAQRCTAWAVILQQGAQRGDLAVKYLKRRAEAFEESYQACFNLGDIYCRIAEYDSAAKYIERGLKVVPDDTRFLVNMSKVEKFWENYESSVEWARRALHIEPTSVEALTELGIALSFCDAPEESLPHFRKAHQLAPGNYNQLLNLGLCYGMLGHLDSAYCYVHAALELAPCEKQAELYAYITAAALELGRKSDAAEHLHQLRQIAPDAPMLGELTVRLAQFEE